MSDSFLKITKFYLEKKKLDRVRPKPKKQKKRKAKKYDEEEGNAEV